MKKIFSCSPSEGMGMKVGEVLLCVVATRERGGRGGGGGGGG